MKGFISYAHDDHAMLDRFRVHLAALGEPFGLTFWSDESLRAGHHWNPKILDAINQADAFLLPVSPSWIASKFIRDQERPAITAPNFAPEDRSGTRTDLSDLRPLAALTALQSLNLGGTSVSNVTALRSLPALKWLDLTGIRSAGVDALRRPGWRSRAGHSARSALPQPRGVPSGDRQRDCLGRVEHGSTVYPLPLGRVPAARESRRRTGS